MNLRRYFRISHKDTRRSLICYKIHNSLAVISRETSPPTREPHRCDAYMRAENVITPAIGATLQLIYSFAKRFYQHIDYY